MFLAEQNVSSTFVRHLLLLLIPNLISSSFLYLACFLSSLFFLSLPELPSVSLLQRTPSSPISCLATGFYPHRASLVWRKDGEELHEEVDHGEILPNHDGTFQMSVDLNLSSVTPEDWTRYDCVFQLSGVKEEIITRLEKDRIRTNWGKSESGGCWRGVHGNSCWTVITNYYCIQQRSTFLSSRSLLQWLFSLSLSSVLLESSFTKRRKVREKNEWFQSLSWCLWKIQTSEEERQSALNRLSTNRNSVEWVEEDK